MESDIVYFRRRASDERSAALQARNAEARLRHAEMANRYEDLVRAIVGSHQHFGIGDADDSLRSPLASASPKRDRLTDAAL